MKLKIEYQKRDKFRNSAIIFPLYESNKYLMLYIFYILKRRFKSNDYVCIYTQTPPLELEILKSIFDVVIKVPKSDEMEDAVNSIHNCISFCPYRKITFIGSDCIDNKFNFICPSELPRKSCNTFDFINSDMIYLTSSQRISANRSYQTCKHTYIYMNIGKPESKTRQVILKKINTDKFKNVLSINIDNLSGIKRKACKFDKMSKEKITNSLELYKKLKRKMPDIKQLEELVNTTDNDNTDLYGYKLSKKRDYSIVNKRINDQVKANKKKL